MSTAEQLQQDIQDFPDYVSPFPAPRLVPAPIELPSQAPEQPRGFLLGTRAVQQFIEAINTDGQKTNRLLYRGLFAGPGEFPARGSRREPQDEERERQAGITYDPSIEYGAFSTIYNNVDARNYDPSQPSVLGMYGNQPNSEPIRYSAQIPFWYVKPEEQQPYVRLAHPKQRVTGTFRDLETGNGISYDSQGIGIIKDEPLAVVFAVRAAARIHRVELQPLDYLV